MNITEFNTLKHSDDPEDITKCWEFLLHRLGKFIYKLCNIATNDSNIEDVKQDSYLAYVENIDMIRSTDNLKSLVSKFQNKTRAYSRKNNRFNAYVGNQVCRLRYDRYEREMINTVRYNIFAEESEMEDLKHVVLQELRKRNPKDYEKLLEAVEDTKDRSRIIKLVDDFIRRNNEPQHS